MSGVKSNIDDFELPSEADMKAALTRIARFAEVRFAGRVRRSYFIQGNPVTDRFRINPGSKLRIMRGRLMRAIAGKFGGGGSRDAETKVVVTQNGFTYTKTINLPYAAIHEFGGTVIIPIAAKSRAFFWAMFRQEGDEKWKFMALSKKKSFTVKMPARPYAGPALKDEAQAIETYAVDEWVRVIQSGRRGR